MAHAGGRPRTPREVKRRRGTLRKDRDGGAPLIVLSNVEEAPLAVDQSAREFIQDVLDSGAKTWIGPTDAVMLELARRLWDDADRARRVWLLQLQGQDRTEVAHHDEKLFNAYRDLTRQLVACLSALGLDPSARARLGVAEVKRQSVAESLAAKRAERRGGRRAG